VGLRDPSVFGRKWQTGSLAAVNSLMLSVDYAVVGERFVTKRELLAD